MRDFIFESASSGIPDGNPDAASTASAVSAASAVSGGAAASAVDAPSASRIIADLTHALCDVLSCSRSVVELSVATFVAGGHLLLEDVPGVGKTTLARALSIAIGGTSRRIQFTPDMLPTDLTGVSVYSQATGRFDFHPGPLFANVVIADEVNRANPKAQSAMLEAMGESQVSVDGQTYAMPDPFFVVATQNPIELEGTYPLPEAQLDRFMTCTSFGYPTPDAEAAMLMNARAVDPLNDLEQVCGLDLMRLVRECCRGVRVSAPIAHYVVALVSATRSMDGVRYGVSPRGALALTAMARAHALTQGRDFVLADDVQAVAVPALSHRLVLDDAGYGMPSIERARMVIASLVADSPVPHADAAVRRSASRSAPSRSASSHVEGMPRKETAARSVSGRMVSSSPDGR